jgi:pyruvate dehydrogenase E2 component (dihydrolipoamide acetyltransferase)
MDEHGLTVADFSGFVGERIGEADVRRLLAERSSQAIKPLTSLQATAARRLTQSFRDVPQFSVRFRVNADHLSVIRPELASQTGQKLTWNDFFIRAIAAAAAMEPSVQRQFSEAGFLCPESVNVGFAVDTDAGLVVPVIKDAGRLTVSEISAIAADLTWKARSNALSFADASGGTITVSNLGMFGIDSFVPIVNPPESIIVGIGGIRNVAEWIDGSFQAQQIVELTLACDHRAVDGAMAARFCQRLTRILESGPEEGW